MFYKNFCIFNMILLISKSFFKPYFIQSLSVHIHPRKLYVPWPFTPIPQGGILKDMPSRWFNKVV